MIRWWDRWLKDEDNGIDREPPIVLFAQRSTRPGATRPEMEGEWRYEPTWPAERLRPTRARARPTPRPTRRATGRDDVLEVRGDVGWTAWISCAGQPAVGAARRPTPGRGVLAHVHVARARARLEILGHARLTVSLTSSAPIAYLSAKLCDVFPDGASSLVSRNILNLAHRDSREEPSPLEPGASVRGHDRPGGGLVDVRGGSSHPAGPRRHGLAERLVAARARHAHDRPIRRDARPSRCSTDRRPPRRARRSPAARSARAPCRTAGSGGYDWRIEHDVPTAETRAVVANYGDYPVKDDIAIVRGALRRAW